MDKRTDVINIAEILKDKKVGTKLYSPIFGECFLQEINFKAHCPIAIRSKDSKDYFLQDGRYYDVPSSECLIFPSKLMKDWRKFAWKKGDVLVSNDSKETIFFDRFTDDTYTKFVGKYVWGESVPAYRRFSKKEEILFTKNYSLEENKENIKKHILTVEACILKAGLNLETLETILLKDGDIYFCKTYRTIKIGIFKSLYEDHNEVYISNYVHYYANASTPYLDYSNDDWVDEGIYRPATNEEKQQLFDALAKKGKTWDAEKKQIVDLKPKIELKPFDKIVGFEELSKQWVCDMFSHYSKNYEGKEIITALGGCAYIKALPFNEETAKLIGTTNNWKG